MQKDLDQWFSVCRLQTPNKQITSSYLHIKNRQSLNSAHLQVLMWIFLMDGCFSSGASSTTHDATGKDQKLEARAVRIAVDVALREKSEGTFMFSR